MNTKKIMNTGQLKIIFRYQQLQHLKLKLGGILFDRCNDKS